MNTTKLQSFLTSQPSQDFRQFWDWRDFKFCCLLSTVTQENVFFWCLYQDFRAARALHWLEQHFLFELIVLQMGYWIPKRPDRVDIVSLRVHIHLSQCSEFCCFRLHCFGNFHVFTTILKATMLLCWRFPCCLWSQSSIYWTSKDMRDLCVFNQGERSNWFILFPKDATSCFVVKDGQQASGWGASCVSSSVLARCQKKNSLLRSQSNTAELTWSFNDRRIVSNHA